MGCIKKKGCIEMQPKLKNATFCNPMQPVSKIAYYFMKKAREGVLFSMIYVTFYLIAEN